MTNINELFYIPFLKFKQNEIMALKELEPAIKDKITPFFDYPPDQDDKKPKSMDEQVPKRAKQLQKHFGAGKTIYVDAYDIDDHDIGGVHSYLYLLRELNTMRCIPVTGIDRTIEHKQAIKDFLAESEEPENTIALRVAYEDFPSYYAIEYDIEDAMDGLLNDLFTQIDLVMDCRITHWMDDIKVDETANNITDFILKFTKNYPVRNVIVTGSSIPLMLKEICPTRNYRILERNEVSIYEKVSTFLKGYEKHIYMGDFTTVSPEFAQPNTIAALNGASKLIYAHQNFQHIWRGGRVLPRNFHYYNEHIRELLVITPSIFRHGNSWGDIKFYDKRNDNGGFTSSSIIKPMVSSHITHMSQIYSR
jgi:hypothetical protein